MVSETGQKLIFFYFQGNSYQYSLKETYSFVIFQGGPQTPLPDLGMLCVASITFTYRVVYL